MEIEKLRKTFQDFTEEVNNQLGKQNHAMPLIGQGKDREEYGLKVVFESELNFMNDFSYQLPVATVTDAIYNIANEVTSMESEAFRLVNTSEKIIKDLLENIKSFEKAKNFFHVEMYNKDTEEAIKMKEYCPYNDIREFTTFLSFVYPIGGNTLRIVIPQGLMEVYSSEKNMDVKQLTDSAFYYAMLNDCKESDVQNLMDMFIGGNISEETFKDEENPPLFLATNKSDRAGSLMVNFPFLESLASAYNLAKFFIIPSSVHEILLLLVENIDEELLNYTKEMIQNVNQSSMEAWERLSDNLYCYDALLKDIAIV